MTSKELIHQRFGLSYASYLVLPRSILQSMPTKWQKEFVKLLDQLDEVCEMHNIVTPNYTVQARDRGTFIKDPYMDYRRGCRNVFEETGPIKGINR